MRYRPGRGRLGAAGPTPGDEGMVTAELAVALPSVVLVLAAAVTALLAVAMNLRCTDAAATAARLLARGAPATAARSAACAVAGSAAEVRISSAAGSVTVTVRAAVPMPGVGRLLHLPPVSAAFTQ